MFGRHSDCGIGSGLPGKVPSHANRRGSISITSIFFVIFFAMLLGMVMNIGRHANRKIAMQNGADAAAYTGGVVLARGMNTLVFTNHLLCDSFGVTAYLREARDRKAEARALAELSAMASRLNPQRDGKLLGRIRAEQNLIRVFGNRNAAIANQLLPEFRSMLNSEKIPVFQRALVDETPRLALNAAWEIGDRQNPATAGLSGGSGMQTMLWRTDVTTLEFEPDTGIPTLPVMDPLLDESESGQQYFLPAIQQRSWLSSRYLRLLNRTMLRDFDRLALSGFSTYWRTYTNGNLRDELDSYPFSNLLFQLRDDPEMVLNPNGYIERELMFVSVSSWDSMPERLPGLFANPLDADDLAYTQIRLFLPRGRLLYDPDGPLGPRVWRESSLPRNLLNQGWTTQIVPATSSSIPVILESSPFGSSIVAPNLGGINVEEFRRLNTH